MHSDKTVYMCQCRLYVTHGDIQPSPLFFPELNKDNTFVKNASFIKFLPKLRVSKESIKYCTIYCTEKCISLCCHFPTSSFRSSKYFSAAISMAEALLLWHKWMLIIFHFQFKVVNTANNSESDLINEALIIFSMLFKRKDFH